MSSENKLYDTYIKIKNGTPEEAQKAYQELWKVVYAIAKKRWLSVYGIDDPDIVGEAALEAMALIVERIHNLHEEATFPGYVKYEVWDAVGKTYRRFDMKEVETTSDDELLPLAGKSELGSNLTAHIIEKEEEEMVLRAIERLSNHNMRQVILYRLKEVPYNQIAELLNITGNNARGLYSRALNKLSKDQELKEYFKSENDNII